MIDSQIGPVVSRDARRVTPSTSVGEAAQHLRDPSVPAIVVQPETEAEEAPVGIVTESDLVALLAETDPPVTVAQCMSSPVRTIRPDATIREAAARMRRIGVKHLPVVDDRERYHGTVSAPALAPYLSRRSLEIEWKGDPLEVDAAGVGRLTVE